MTTPLKLIYAALIGAGALTVVQPAPLLASTSTPTPSVVQTSASYAAALPADRGKSTTSALLAPRTKPEAAQAKQSTALAAASCTPADFARTGAALVSFIKSSTTECVNTLFSLTGTDAYNAFREAQMVTVAYGMRDNPYPGNASTSMEQLVLFLRAGYYVQFYRPGDVGSYGPTLTTAIRAALDTFYANPRSQDVTDANGEVLGEAVILIDSSGENVRYLYVVKRLLNAFNGQYNSLWYMRGAVNNTFTVLFRGHWVTGFKEAVTADPSVLDVVYNFANNNFSLLGTDSSFMVANAGGELTRFLDTPALMAKVRPLAKALLNRGSMTGPTAPLWIRIADIATYHDNANCSYYGICDFKTRLEASVLPIRHVCSPQITIRAQDISTANLNASCTSLAGQVAYFHNIMRSNNSTPVANDYNTSLEVVAFHSSDDYGTYAGVLFGIDTNNGGMYLEGNPAQQGNIPRFIAYEAEWQRPTFAIWNLNHEFTHYLDGRFNMYGDFEAGLAAPNIWWVEGAAEYVSYHYRGLAYDSALAAAKLKTYSLSTLWGTTYENSNSSRIYSWGYLASRYMIERHPSDVQTILARFRVGDYAGAYTYYNSTIGTRYNADFNSWLDTLSGTPGNVSPTANFTSVVNGLTVTFTDSSTDSDGTIASRQWTFGDGTSSTATNPVKTYSAAGTYTVTLTVTDNLGATGSKSAQVIVSSSTAPECTGSDVRTLGKNCKRSNLSATTGNLYYLYIYLPAGVSTLSITSAGGTGNADLYYNSGAWATPSAYTQRSVNSGNTESITVNNPAAGYRYISLYATSAFSGVTVTTRY